MEIKHASRFISLHALNFRHGEKKTNCTRVHEIHDFYAGNFAYKRPENSVAIAYLIMAYKNAEQLWRVKESFFYRLYKLIFQLFRSIYRPWHSFHIHIDSKAKRSLYNEVQLLEKCLDNVRLSKNRRSITWGSIEVLLAAVDGARELLENAK